MVDPQTLRLAPPLDSSSRGEDDNDGTDGPEVHVWTARLGVLRPTLPRFEALLSPAEREAQRRFVRAHDRAMFALSRGSRRVLLADYLGTSADALVFGENRWGKPHLDAPLTDLRFNVSHSGDVSVLAVVRGRDVGIDVERMGEATDLDRIAAHCFSPGERESLEVTPAHLRRDAFFACWSRKEAIIKGLGMGLSFPLDAFDVTLDPESPPRLVASRDLRLDVASWSMHAIRVPRGYAGALVVRGKKAARIRSFTL